MRGTKIAREEREEEIWRKPVLFLVPDFYAARMEGKKKKRRIIYLLIFSTFPPAVHSFLTISPFPYSPQALSPSLSPPSHQPQQPQKHCNPIQSSKGKRFTPCKPRKASLCSAPEPEMNASQRANTLTWSLYVIIESLWYSSPGFSLSSLTGGIIFFCVGVLVWRWLWRNGLIGNNLIFCPRERGPW